MLFFHSSFIFFPSAPYIILNTLFSNTMFFLQIGKSYETKFSSFFKWHAINTNLD